MDVFVARQPILNKNHEIYAYELLYRGDDGPNAQPVSGDAATSDVIINSFFNIGIEQLSEGKLCFINFTENILKKEFPSHLSPDKVVVEILETVKLTSEVIEICKKLSKKGYQIALDDFILLEDDLNLVEILKYIDIVKVDILNTPRQTQKKILEFLKPFNVKLLAEKVETREVYEQCVNEGYMYFQGYYFSKPVIISSTDVPVFNGVFLNILTELSKEEPNIDLITQAIEKDVSLSYKLLRLINSSARTAHKIKSLKQAIVLLGLNEIKKWIYFLSLSQSNNSHFKAPKEIIKMSFIRAKGSELIAMNVGKSHEHSSYFLTGMFSLIDSLLQVPIETVMKSLPLEKEILDALLGKQNHHKDILDLTIAIEQAKWEDIDRITSRIGITKENAFEIHANSINWSKNLFVVE
ncbi:EAL and HDOD domain-containing protein [Bacillus alkalicellulosilyticus]|uniref:EAL and HDOD domain-containing protein n=1 Tax=Alkalihalobacterium alkalicellulosilyticum TaxID=1912214 RepID=UPI000996B95C|nr:HDOD domain-containing protein [Bacillus alkalicellulosilyticus]